MAAAARCVASCLELELAAMISLPAYQRLTSTTSHLLHESALESYLRWLYRSAREILALDDGARSMLERAGISARRPPRPATQPALLAAETGARELAAPAC